MIIYIDLLIILNFIYDFLLLMTVSVTLKRYTKLKRLLFGSLFGSLTTLVIMLPINSYLLLIIKIILGIFMLIITFGYKNIRYTLQNIMYLYMTCVILAGFLYFLKLEFSNMSYLLVMFIAPFILYLYIKMQKELKEKVNYYKKVIINFKNNKSLELNGFIDSGNKLRDPITKKYIILINKNKLKGIYNIRSPIYVPIKTVNKNSLIECISIKNIVIDDISYNDYLLGITDNEFIDFDCLLNYHLLEG